MNTVSKKLTLLCGILWLLPGISQARITGIWNTTALTRVDITAIRAPGLIPEHTVDIADGSYEFGNYGDFNAGDISGFWQQKRNQYSIAVNRYALEDQFRTSLEQTPGLIVNQVKLLKIKLTGNELDDGIWGSESYEYRIDTSQEGHREIIRLVMTVNVAGHRQPETPAATAVNKSPTQAAIAAAQVPHSQIHIAVSAVLNHINRTNSTGQ